MRMRLPNNGFQEAGRYTLAQCALVALHRRSVMLNLWRQSYGDKDCRAIAVADAMDEHGEADGPAVLEAFDKRNYVWKKMWLH